MPWFCRTIGNGKDWVLVLSRRIGQLSIILLSLALTGIVGTVPNAFAAESYTLAAFPFRSQEGSTETIVLHVSGATPSTLYEFVFGVQDPATNVWLSSAIQHNTISIETEFSIVISFPSSSFTGGTTSLVGLYGAAVSQTKPVVKSNVAGTFFLIGLTDKTTYLRTQTVSIVATGYQPNEPATVNIRMSPSSVVVFNNPTFASSSGVVSDSWYIPPNADTSQTYVVTVSGTTTTKNPSDVDTFTVNPALVTIASLTSDKPSYQRTQQASLSFRAVYPSGGDATTGSANVTLVRPDSTTFNIVATYNFTAQLFVAKYRFSITDQVGNWIARLVVNSFDDSYGNKGPTALVTTGFTVQKATLSVITSLAKTTFVINERIPLNATVRYPDGISLTTAGTVTAQLSLNGGTYVTSFSLLYDTSSSQWIGLYVPTGNEPPGLWSLTVNGTDSSTPINTGAGSTAITVNKRTSSVNVACTPSQITVGQQVTCTATVADVDVGTAMTPTGTVTISPAFANPLSCALPTGSGGTASCSVIFVTGANSAGPNSVNVSYGGDSKESLSSSTLSVLIQSPSNNSGLNPLTLPLFYFAIIAAIIGGIVAFFLAFRHKTTHTKLKIDLEAVKSEAGKIENNEFFQSVKDQLSKDREEAGTSGKGGGQ